MGRVSSTRGGGEEEGCSEHEGPAKALARGLNEHGRCGPQHMGCAWPRGKGQEGRRRAQVLR